MKSSMSLLSCYLSFCLCLFSCIKPEQHTLKRNWMPEDLATYGVDLAAPDAGQQLEKKAALAKEDAKAVVTYYNFCKEVMQKRKDEKKKYEQMLIDAQRKKEELAKRIEEERIIREKTQASADMLSYSFKVNKLGWVNIDKFYNAPDAIASNVLIKLKSQEAVDYAQVGMVFKNVNSYLSLYSAGNAQYALKGVKLPQGSPVKIIAVLMKDDKAWYCEQDYATSSDVSLNLELKPMTKEALKAVLAGL